MAGRNLFAAQPITTQQPVGRNLFAPQEEQAPEQPSFPGATVAEPAATLISGAIAEPIAGLAGIAQAINPFAEEGAGARAVEATREALTFKPRTQAGQAGLQAVGEVVAPIGEVLQSAETFLGDETFEATGSPALAAAAATLPTAMIEALGLASAKGAIKGTARAKAIAKNKQVRKAVVDAVPDIDQIKDASRAVYKELDESGVRLLPKAYDGLNNRIQQAVNKAGFDADLAPKTAAVIKRVASEKGKVHTLTEIDTLRKVAQNAASALEPADARLGAIIIDEMDSFLDVVKPEAFARGAVKAKDVTPKFKVARELWGRARRSELINEAFEKAKNQASGFENGIVTQFRSILNNKKKARFFKPKELQVMQEVVRGTPGANLAKAIGRFGFSEGHATNILGGSIGVAAGASLGGAPGAVAVPLIGQVSRKLAQKLTRGKAEFADIVVRAGDNANDIAKAYMAKVPKAQRSASELSELLLRPDIAIEQLGLSKNSFMREAAEIAQGSRVMNAIGATGETIKKKLGEQRGSISFKPSSREGKIGGVFKAFDDPETGIKFETGKPATFKFIRNTQSAPRPSRGGIDQFQQKVEPAGRYMQGVSPKYKTKLPGFEEGEITFKSPLVLEWNSTPGGGYDATSWKARLSKNFGGAKGNKLSQKIADAGYDGIVTVDVRGGGRSSTSEMVDLSHLK